MEDEIKRLRQDVEHLRDEIYGNGGKGGVAAHLQRLADGQDGMRAEMFGLKEEVRGVKEYQKAQNGRVDKIDLTLAEGRGAMVEREKWERRQADSIKWLFMAGLAAAGVLSGIVFGAIDRLSP